VISEGQADGIDNSLRNIADEVHGICAVLIALVIIQFFALLFRK
jgi:type IV secretory pathway VirB2 component (pilin)